MNVTLSNGKFFQISDGQNVMSPLAEEIYSVIFSGKEAIRGIPVSRVDFLATTVQFSQYASDPLLVLDVIPAINHDRPDASAVTKLVSLVVDLTRELARWRQN